MIRLKTQKLANSGLIYVLIGQRPDGLSSMLWYNCYPINHYVTSTNGIQAQKQPSEDGQSKQAVQSVVSLEGVQVAPNKRKFDQLEGVKPSSTAPQVSEARSEYDSTDSSEESSGSMEAEPPTNEATSGFFGENQPPITVMGGVPDTGNPVGELNKNGEGKSGRRGKKQNKKKSQGNALKDTSQLTRKQKKKKRAKAAAKRQKKMLQQGP